MPEKTNAPLGSEGQSTVGGLPGNPEMSQNINTLANVRAGDLREHST
jgi:hypothetical protein